MVGAAVCELDRCPEVKGFRIAVYTESAGFRVRGHLWLFCESESPNLTPRECRAPFGAARRWLQVRNSAKRHVANASNARPFWRGPVTSPPVTCCPSHPDEI